MTSHFLDGKAELYLRSSEDTIHINVTRAVGFDGELILDNVIVTNEFDGYKEVFRAPEEIFDILGLTITESDPYYAKLTAAEHGIQEFMNYSVTVFYRYVPSGEYLPESGSISASIMTATSHEGPSQDPDKLPGMLSIEYISFFEGYESIHAVIAIDLTHFADGYFSLNTTVKSNSAEQSFGADDMNFNLSVAKDEYGQTVRTGYYYLTIYTRDFGYGKITVMVDIQYHSENGMVYVDTRQEEYIMRFHWFFLSDKGVFKVTAYEWNVFRGLLLAQAARFGVPEEEAVFYTEDAVAGQQITYDLINALFIGLAKVYNACGITEDDNDFPLFTSMGIGKMPDGARSAYDVFSVLENHINRLILL